VAIKVMRSSEADSAKRFLAEARRTFRIKHPNCVEVTDCGVVDDGALLYLTMEILEGRTLSEELERDGPIAPDRVAHIGAQVAAAIGCAHELGYVHRDLKPDNIMLLHRGSDPDFVKVLDFGLAKLYDAARLENTRSVMSFTQDGMIFGTPHYMSPEQAQGKKLDPRSDLYSLGVVLYEALAGRVPFDSEAQVEILIAHVKERPPRLSSLRRDLPPALTALVHELLRKDPDRRPASAAGVSSQLYSLVGPSSSPGRVSPRLASSETIQLEATPATPERGQTIRAPAPAPASIPPGGQATALTRALGPETLAAVRPPRWRLAALAAALIALFGAGALLAWAATQSSGPASGADAAALPDAAPGVLWIDAAPVPDAASPPIDAAAAPTADAGVAKPAIRPERRRSMALLREHGKTSIKLRRLALAQKAFRADPTYTRARLAFADALLASGGDANKKRACALLSRHPRRRQRAGCGD
jgi:serine/threonine-protein kinase